MTKKSNDNTSLIDQDDLREITDNLVSYKRGGKRQKFFVYWFLGCSIKAAADLSNTSVSYAYNMVQKYRKLPKWRQSVDEFFGDLPARYQNLCKARLIEISDIEAGALAAYRDDKTLAIEKPKLLADIKRAAGALSERGPVNINFGYQQLQANLAATIIGPSDAAVLPLPDADAVDAECCEVVEGVE